jgi:pyruvate-formate lyase-activating enzyme
MEEADDYKFDVVQKRAEEINKISPSFCLAKWLQSTVLLYNGSTHSCHHPSRHKIDPESLKDNPQGLHNTPTKLKAREELLSGVQTSECGYCWNIENLNREHLSDRIYKSTYGWSFSRMDEVLESGTGKDIVPSYLEIAFDSKCNSRCLYCNPESSSSWEQEVKRFGPIPTVDGGLYDLGYLKSMGSLPIAQGETNPYIEAFWKWWPDLYKKLHMLRVTGGEPLMSPHTWRLVELIEKEPRKELAFSINSNLCLPTAMIKRLSNKINSLHGKIKSFEIFTSLESVGPQAEYVRYGMNYEEFLANCYYLLDSTPREVRLNFMTTINMLSAPSFMGFLKLIKEMRKSYSISSPFNFRVRTFFNYLRWPACFSLTMLPNHLKEKYRKEWVEFVEEHVMTDTPRAGQCFYIEELQQVRRLVDFMCSQNPIEKEHTNFKLFIQAIDERRNLNFASTFPELTDVLSEEFYGRV